MLPGKAFVSGYFVSAARVSKKAAFSAINANTTGAEFYRISFANKEMAKPTVLDILFRVSQ